MKRILLTFVLSVLTAGLLGSCSKINGRIDDLEKRVDGIESTSIASVQQQIDGIKASISNLETIRTDIRTLMDAKTAQDEDITALKTADDALGDRIDQLKDFVDNTLKACAAEEWCKATFATLEQHHWTCDTIAKLDARLGMLDEKLAAGIEDCKTSLRNWVNEQLDAYYTAAEIDAALGLMNDNIDEALAEGLLSKEKTDSLATELTKTKASVDTAKSNIRSEYKAAIQSAIETCEGKLTQALKDSIATVNDKIESLATRVATLESEVAVLTGRIDAIEAMIQSVTIVPAYSDGSVKAADGVLELNLIVSPVEAAKGLTRDSVKILTNAVRTKAAGVDTVKTENISSFYVDESKGTIEIKADISDKLPSDASQHLTIAVNVKNGLSHCVTEFVPVENVITVAGILPEGFPTEEPNGQAPPEDAWISIAAGQKCYLSANKSMLFFDNEGIKYGVSTDKIVLEDNGNYVCTVGSSVTITFNMLDQELSNIKFEDTSSSTWNGSYQQTACIAAGTMITMGNGERKAVEMLEVGDVIQTFDHETGEASSSPVSFIMESKSAVNAFTLTFEGDISVRVIEEHGFYDREKQKYVFINPRNAKDYIGHHFYNADNGGWFELESCDLLDGSVDAYAIVTSRHLNHTSNGMLSMCDGTVEIFANLFEYNNQIMFDADKKNQDIEKYGLTPIEKVLEFEGFTESDYYDYNLQYLNIAIGKGLISWEWVKAFSDYCVANDIY